MIYFVRVYSENQDLRIGETFLKIGYSSNGGQSRLGSLQAGNPDKLELFFEVYGDKDTECLVHKYFSEDRVNGEWFKINENNYKYFDIMLHFFDYAYRSANELKNIDEETYNKKVAEEINKSIDFLIKLKRYNSFKEKADQQDFSHLEDMAGDGI
uniref:Bacteriophage T5 Orf172 DNA-binding domain-containing protein n=1 Tax=viral metagenome TaxID=1070528 RepID=A0A6H1ZNR3_9ZZZZ